MRVIQDSDDESDGNLEDETQKPQATNASAIQHEPTKDASPGISSTGAYTRHRNHPLKKLTNRVRILEKGVYRTRSWSFSISIGSICCAFGIPF
jgi:hypothetical protein